ncbi:cysteine hydrolase [Solirubrobacter sp. CPCC 204708]|uniref:Cysteine hydrolase n=1 Tax=Solirubrobacter deserti TaxID=2282478 RepID=A0ABT4RCA3_9ACTN|nr:isochorismatase family cysteine hydrolase [Solirubrobacter deserti]MBE2315524.1 cysteine hydrolase [Solirubrobacter deserti]MDA0136163.1 cysteine hydrolase [Solirubrobacter deserti]
MPTTALIVVDMLNAYDHEDADQLAECVERQLPQMVQLRDTAAERDDILLVYVQDNYDAWEVGREQLVDRALKGEHPELVEPIAPSDGVAFLPKGRHSIFYQTALDHVLSVGDVKKVVLVGQVTEQCVLYSALDAYLRGYEVTVPRDAVAHIDKELADAALKMMERNLHADLSPAAEVFQPVTS